MSRFDVHRIATGVTRGIHYRGSEVHGERRVEA